MPRILVVDDESLIRELVRDVVAALGFEIVTAASLAEGLALGRKGVDIILLDVLLPDGDGLAHLEAFAQLPGRPDIIVITGHGDADAAESALRAGAWEYLVKPIRTRELTLALSQAVQWRASKGDRSHSLLRRPDIIGSSSALIEVLEQLREAATSNVNVLITGETGTGKELFACALHGNSPRMAGPFTTVDCTTLPETLVEAHLFGHAKGAFTGADRAREGLLTAADGGTLFLDEVGDLPLPVQGAFLRALELHRFRPVGELREITSDFRIVAATNRDLDDMVRMDLYRSDLRFRLRGLHIHVPPLRRRVEDIPLLAAHFVNRHCRQHQRPDKELTAGCCDMLMAYCWPGNVRELAHAIERACIASGDGEQLFARHLPTEIRIAMARERLVSRDSTREQHLAATPAPKPLCTDANAPASTHQPDDSPLPESFPLLREMKARAEERYLTELLAVCLGDVRRAAGIAGVSRGHLYELLRKYEL